jgi:NADH-quinone oxidoreductase subunit L
VLGFGLQLFQIVVGFLVGRALYRKAPERDPLLRLGSVYTLLDNRYYLDHIYNNGVVYPLRDRVAVAMAWTNDNVIDRAVYLAGTGTARLGEATYEGADQRGIDGVVHGLGFSAMWSGAKARLSQSGNVQLYAGAMFVGVIVLGVLFVIGAT